MTVSEIWSKAISWLQNFVINVNPVVDDIITVVFTPIGEVLSELGMLPDLPNWIQQVLFPLIADQSLFELMLGGGLAFFIGYTIVKWIIGIVTGS